MCFDRFLILMLVFSLKFVGLMSQPLSIRLKIQPGQSDYPIVLQADETKFNEFIQRKKELQVASKHDDYYYVYTNYETIKTLYRSSWVKRIEDGKRNFIPLLDSSRIFSNVDSVHAGNAPLIQDYKGRNVLVGIIDFGIEWRHLDFKNAANDTRILYIWDQNYDSIPPSGYTYGHLWSKKDIDSGRCRHYPNAQFGHGTNVTGIAVGNGNVLPQFKGMAPESKIIAVSIKNNNLWMNQINDAVDFIFKKADTLNIPCVINISIGDYDGSHDGRDLSTRIMESKLNKKGRCIVAAAGNAGQYDQHIQMTPGNDTVFSDFKHNNDYGGTYFNFWADTADVKTLTIGIQADTAWNLLPISKKYFFNFKTRFLDSLQKFGYYEDSMMVQNPIDSTIAKAYFALVKQENTVNFQCYIVPKNTAHLWRLSASGNSKLDLWVYYGLQSTSFVHLSPLPDTITNPSVKFYKLPDKNMSLVSGFQCSDKILTVGNYVNKSGYINIDGNYIFVGETREQISASSSKGPTRDQRLKPDISAPGSLTITTVDSFTSASFAVTGNRIKLGPTGKYARGGGTSMASPAACGIASLLLEKNPNLDYNQLKYLIAKTAKRDGFTTSNPTNEYGYGKINAFQLLKYNFTYGCKDTGSLNYNASADFEDSTLCIKKVYGCTDTGSINYNPSANVNNGSCIKKVYGCTDTGSINYNPSANVNNGSCIKKVYGCTDTGSINYKPSANVSNGSCIQKVYGCTDTGSINYNPSANVNNGSCIKKVYGCMDPKASNYNPKANVNNKSCQYPLEIETSMKSKIWNVFPNPSSGLISVESMSQNITTLKIYSINGSLLKQIKFEKSITIDMTGYSKGSYIFITKDHHTEEKFHIQLK